MKCDMVREHLHAYLDGLLAPGEKAGIEQHLAGCAECRAAFGELKKSVEILRGLEEVEPPAWLTQKVMTRVRAERTPKESFLARLLHRFPIGIPATAAASLVIAVAALLVMKEMEPKVQDVVTPGIPGRLQEAPSAKGVGPQVPPPAPKQEEQRQLPPQAEKSGERSSENAPLRQPGQATGAAAPAASSPKPSVMETVKPSGRAGETPLPRSAEEMVPAREKKMSAPLVEPAPAPAAPSRNLFRAAPEAGGIGARKDEAASQDLLQPEKARPRANTEAAGSKGALVQPLKKIVTERHPDGRPKVEVTYRATSSGQVRIMEERFDREGIRDGLQRAYDEQGRTAAEVLYSHGEVVSVREFNPDGTVKTGKAKRDWPWLMDHP